MSKVDHFIEFINPPYFYQDVSFGTKLLKLDSGETIEMPNVVRTGTRSTMISQYIQFCQEEKCEQLSRSSLFKILEVREAFQRKSLDPSVYDSDLNIPGYLLTRQDRGPQKKGGGLIVYAKSKFKVSVLDTWSSVSEYNFQQLWLKVQCRKFRSFLLCTVYRPPDASISFLEDLTKTVVESLLQGVTVVLLGDLNCDVLGNGPDGRALNNFCLRFNLAQMVKSPTRVTETSKSIIDVVLTTNQSIISSCDVKVCTTALLHYTDELLKNMDDRKISVIFLLDMSKAFDSIRHDLLINKLYKLGVSFAACSWFLSYLSQRMQVVRIEDSLSEPLPLKAGVPQGSILGPVLFTLYVNDLLQVPKRCRALGYVDDTKVFMALPSSQLPEAVTAVNQDLRDLSSWCCAHSLLINPDKTKLIFVGVPQLTRSISTLPPVMLLGREVKPSTVTKDLSVHIDCHLNYNEHIAKTVSTCTYMLRRVNRIKHLLDSKTLVFLMNAFILSRLYYCSTVWSNTTKENIKNIK